MKNLRIALAALALAGLSVPAGAHHNANAEWDMSKVVPLVATLKSVRDISPHAIWILEVKDKSGKTTEWRLEALSSNALRRVGVVVKRDIVPGKVYTFYISPARKAGQPGGLLQGIEINGKKVTIVKT